MILLDRVSFKEQVFKRDNHQCVICKKPAVDSHHIIDRSLWKDGGYYIDNGVSLCSEHHLLAEQTILSCEELREKAGIKNTIYPDYLGLSEFVLSYDHFGNPIYKNGKRGIGYFFKNENVQKVLKQGNILHLFEPDFERIVDKYPRTYHLPTSLGTTSDDRISKNINIILNGEIIITEKLDGSNTSMSEFGLYGRSRTEPSNNPWDTWLIPKWQIIKNDLKSFNLEICGENMFGEHSIIYSKLEEHFYVFGIRHTEHNIWLSWEETEYYAELFDFKTVPILFKSDKNWNVSLEDFNILTEKILSEPSVFNDSNIWNTPKEGFVVRIEREFPNTMFYNSVFKWVRAKHVKTDEHWTKNWKRARLYNELKDLSKEKILDLYNSHIVENLITIK